MKYFLSQSYIHTSLPPSLSLSLSPTSSFSLSLSLSPTSSFSLSLSLSLTCNISLGPAASPFACSTSCLKRETHDCLSLASAALSLYVSLFAACTVND